MIDFADGTVIRRTFHKFRVLVCFIGYLSKPGDVLVDLGFGISFRGFQGKRLGNDERMVARPHVESEIDHSVGDVFCGDARILGELLPAVAHLFDSVVAFGKRR